MQKAFSLVELSIVLVILGLLTGGILAGQSLIRAAELRSTTSTLQRYESAIRTFQDKYFALPGDMRNATQFWGVLAGDGTNATCQNTPASGAATCNGNGDGWIDHNSVNGGERFRAFQHLANAGLIEGSFTGTNVTADWWGWQAGVNVPAGKISDTAFSFMAINWVVGAGETHFVGTRQSNHIVVINSSVSNNLPFIKPDEVWNIDTKLDDGKPGYGKITVYKNSEDPNCTTSDSIFTSEYMLSYTSKACKIIKYAF